MGKRVPPIRLDVMFKELGKPKFNALDADIALWLLWRRSIRKPVSALWVAENIPGISRGMVENFFSKKFGIGQIPDSELNLRSICQLFEVKVIPEKEAEAFIAEVEKQYGEMVDKDRGGKRRVTKRQE